MKKSPFLLATASLFLAGAAAQAGHEIAVSAKDKVIEPPVEEPYRASRGLITLEGPSGMFINPTSATLPQGKFTVQYCLFFPNRDTDVVGHGTLISYGVTDWIEVGFVGNLIDVNADAIPDQRAIRRANARAAAQTLASGTPTAPRITADEAGYDDEFVVGGPMVRVRLVRDLDWHPEISVGGYLKWGTNAFNQGTLFAAMSKRIDIDPDGIFRSVVLQGGYRHTWFDQERGPAGVEDSGRAYAGLELELPYRFYLIGEITQKDTDLDRRTPFAFGIQCRLPGVNLTFAALQDGGQHERIGLYSGVGISFGF